MAHPIIMTTGQVPVPANTPTMILGANSNRTRIRVYCPQGAFFGSDNTVSPTTGFFNAQVQMNFFTQEELWAFFTSNITVQFLEEST